MTYRTYAFSVKESEIDEATLAAIKEEVDALPVGCIRYASADFGARYQRFDGVTGQYKWKPEDINDVHAVSDHFDGVVIFSTGVMGSKDLSLLDAEYVVYGNCNIFDKKPGDEFDHTVIRSKNSHRPESRCREPSCRTRRGHRLDAESCAGLCPDHAICSICSHSRRCAMVSVPQIGMFGLGTAFWVGVAVIVVGLVIQQVMLYNRKKMKHRYPYHFNPDISDPNDALETFFAGADAAHAASEENYLWALLDDGLPCAIAYSRSAITIIPARLSDKRIVAREGKRIELGVLPPHAISIVWLVREDVVSPVYEVHIRYADADKKSEIELFRFDLDLDGSPNYHKFRDFVESVKTLCRMHSITVRDFIRR